MDSKKILFSIGNNDECYTPDYAVKPILKYIPKEAIIWCPFDTEESNCVKMLTKNGHNVYFTHIDLGVDFLNVDPCGAVPSEAGMP